MARHFLFLAALIFVSHTSLADEPASKPAELKLTSPAANATVKGPIDFTVDEKSVPAGASVRWMLNGRDISGPLAIPPYKLAWQSANVWDGPATITARAEDSSGKILAQSSVVSFTIANGDGTIRQVSPGRSKTLSGKISWDVEATRPISDEEKEEQKKRGASGKGDKAIEAIVFFVDGRSVQETHGQAKRAFELDTTTLRNGMHEFYVAAFAYKKGSPPVGMISWRAEVQNGHALMAVRPRWREVILAPEETSELSARAIYTDGAEERISDAIKYTSSAAAVASVDDKGVVKAVAPGVATITLEAQGRKSSALVIVDKPHGFPHFARDGGFLSSYDPKRSMWVRTVFVLTANELDNTPGLAEQVKAAAINTFNTGFYPNPGDSKVNDLATFKRGYENYWGRIEKGAQKYDMSLLLTGDDLCRSDKELDNSVNNSWSGEAIAHAFTKARESKRVIGVEMCDEISFVWGNNPKPTDGRWKKRNPPLEDDAFSKLMKSIHAVENHPGVAWPIGGVAPVEAAKNWIGDQEFSDYTSFYWDIVSWRKAYPWGASLGQLLNDGLEHGVVPRLGVIQRDKPSLLLTSICGNDYRKMGEGDDFVAGRDIVVHPGTTPTLVAAEIMYAAASGMSGARTYRLDNNAWKNNRSGGKVGQADLVSGADPFVVGTERWQAMSSAFNLTRRLEPMMLQPRVSAIDLGENIYTGARRGENSRLLFAINFNEMPTAIRADLTPYRFNSESLGSKMMRYRLVGARLLSERADNREVDELVLQPGECVVWAFTPDLPNGSHSGPPEIVITSPQNESTVAGNVGIGMHVNHDRRLDRVEFFVDGTKLREEKAEGFKYLLGAMEFQLDTSKLTPGIFHAVQAVVTDADGQSSEARIAVKVVKP